MAFKIWQIGLHLQQQEAVAVAIVRGAKECFLQRWWRLPLENDIIKDGRIVDAQQLAKTLLPWSRELPQRHHIMLAFPASRTLQRSFPRPSMSLGEREQTAWLSGTMARELDMDPDSLRFDYSEDSLSPAYNVTAAQSKELATLLTLAERLRVHVSAITPDASALQQFLPFLPSHQQCLAWRDNEQWLWATRCRWGRKLAVGMTSAKELATATPDRFSAFLVADVRCASAAGRRDNANTASDRQRRSAHRRSFASGGTTTRPQLTDNEATFAGATAVTRTAFATAAPATIYPRLAICAGSTGGAFTRARLADNDKLAAGNAGDQGADNKHYRVKRTRNVTPPGCVFSSQSAGSHAAGCAGTLAI